MFSFLRGRRIARERRPYSFVEEIVLMSPLELDRATAAVAGETRLEIRRRGFQLGTSDQEIAGDDDVSVVDWDALEADPP